MQDIFFAVYRQDGIQGTETVFPIVEITTTDGSVYKLQYDRIPARKNNPNGGSFSPNFYIDEYYAGGEEISLTPTAPFICHVYSGSAPHKIQLEIREDGHEETRIFALPDKTQTIESVRLMTESGFGGTLKELTRDEWDAFDFAAVTQPVTETATTAVETAFTAFQTTQTTTASTQQPEPPKPSGNLSAFLPWMISSGVLLVGAIAAAAYFLRTPKQKNPPVSPPPPMPEQEATRRYQGQQKPQQSHGVAANYLQERQKKPEELAKEAEDRAAAEAIKQIKENTNIDVNDPPPQTAKDIVAEVLTDTTLKTNPFDNLGDTPSHIGRRNASGSIDSGQNDSGGLVELPTTNRNSKPAPTQRNDSPKQSMLSEKSAPEIYDDAGGIVEMDVPPVRPTSKPEVQPKPKPAARPDAKPVVISADGYAYFDFSLFKEELVQSFGSPRGSVFRLAGNELEPNPLLNEKVRNKKIWKYRNIAEKFFDITHSGVPESAIVDPSDVNQVKKRGTLILLPEN